jgi:hypothetical protein
VVGGNDDDIALQKITVVKSKEAKIGSNLAESSKENHGSKRAALSMTMMITFPHSSMLRYKID